MAQLSLPNRPLKSRSRRCFAPDQCDLCRYRHNGHYAVSRIMPHGRLSRRRRLHSAMR
ncbi:hypothetical protein GOC55_31925, partial [Sinorhizobium medicae]|nr:hypothetical protein [Sinorhizobium medicae]